MSPACVQPASTMSARTTPGGAGGVPPRALSTEPMLTQAVLDDLAQQLAPKSGFTPQPHVLAASALLAADDTLKAPAACRRAESRGFKHVPPGSYERVRAYARRIRAAVAYTEPVASAERIARPRGRPVSLTTAEREAMAQRQRVEKNGFSHRRTEWRQDRSA